MPGEVGGGESQSADCGNDRSKSYGKSFAEILTGSKQGEVKGGGGHSTCDQGGIKEMEDFLTPSSVAWTTGLVVCPSLSCGAQERSR